MLITAALLLVVAGDSVTRIDTMPRPLADSTPLVVVADTPVVRRHAVQYSDAYYARLTIHRIGSYTMLPLFAAEYALGQNLIQDASPPSWIRPTHGLVAGGIGVLFGVNTITGAWNLWDSRQDPAGRTRRYVHSALMIASDAGFLATGLLAPGHHQRFSSFSDYQNRQRIHKNVAVASISVASIGGVMMWFWK